MLWGGELVLRDGVPVGQLTSAAWGEALAAPVGLGYVRHPDGGVLTAESARGGTYQVSVGGRVCAATVTTRPPFDPAGARLQPG
jgi:4-methylaminobutanoate oxidase (formaldehyde-forming)